MNSSFKLVAGIVIIALILFIFNGCKTYPDYLVLNKSDFKGKKIHDTIEAFPERGLYILSLEKSSFLGHFSWNLGIVKIDKNDPLNSIKYETEIKNKSFRVSKDYVAFVDIHTSEWGWFYIADGKMLDTLPLMAKFIDSIKSISPKNIFIREENGYVEALVNGKVIQRYNYGDFISNNNPVNYDSLDLGLYSIQNNKLINISKDPNYLLKQSNGLFLVPDPGYNLHAKFSKEAILAEIERSFDTKKFSDRIIVKAINN